jgi:hypothetical protein
MPRPNRLGHQATQTFQPEPQPKQAIAPPAWLVMPLLIWNVWQLRWLEAVEEFTAS